MMRDCRDGARSARLTDTGKGRGLPIRCAAVLAVAVLGASARAAEVKFPKTDPRISLEIPEGWTASYTPVGLELQSPEKNSLVVANVVKRDERSVEAWAKEAKERMVAGGIAFDKKAKPPRILTPGRKGDVDLSRSLQPSGEAFSFSGAPSLKPKFSSEPSPNGNADANTSGAAPAGPDSGTAASPMRPFKVVQTFGATMDKKPVDLELAMYPLAKDTFFVIEQQSGPTDSRAAAIVKSFKRVP